jgi:2-amino-4-hydroxy-6-hydroxymethyldihydropteridine diphosphokinase
MEKVVIALGSNLGDRLGYLRQAGSFLSGLSEGIFKKASIWESEPVGAAEYTFLNSAALIETQKKPLDLLAILKSFEQKCGREKEPKRWGPRVLDLDIIAWGDLVIGQETLIIPHPEYHRRLFVLCPMMELLPGWTDPVTHKGIREMIDEAPAIEIHKTDLTW